MILVYLYIAFIALALLSSLPVYRLDILHYKVISAVLVVDLIAEIMANVLIKVFHLSNVPLYNFTMFLEFSLYAYYFRLILTNRKIRQVIRIYLVMLPFLWIGLVIFAFRIDVWNSLFCVIGSIFTIWLAALYYHQLFTADELVKLSTSFEFWVATALIIFYACNFTYLGMLNLLTNNFRSLALKLLTVLQILNIVFYSIYIYAFICVTRIRKSL